MSWIDEKEDNNIPSLFVLSTYCVYLSRMDLNEFIIRKVILHSFFKVICLGKQAAVASLILF